MYQCNNPIVLVPGIVVGIMTVVVVLEVRGNESNSKITFGVIRSNSKSNNSKSSRSTIGVVVGVIVGIMYE